MSYIFFGFLTGLSLILAIGAQNIFVIEQGLKKKHVFIVCLICSSSDLILIFLGIFLFHHFQSFFSPSVELILNLLLLLFLINFIWRKLKSINNKIFINENSGSNTLISTVLKTLGFTYLNPHVYSDTVFFLGNFSKDFLITQKYLFGIGASLSSFLFFFILGYLSKFLSNYIGSERLWKIINYSIVLFMSLLSVYVLMSILK
ncbi:LysE family transporter [Pelagibacterales bacterium SAG-MED16]|nr:LysE family transporter [Pelagibacterales bacterium SAG-MED16]MBD1157640.1 LysE family transporter [Pelagibacterales bacterium SAG-MED17]